MDVLFILSLQLIDFHQLFPRFKLFSLIMWAGNYLSFSCYSVVSHFGFLAFRIFPL